MINWDHDFNSVWLHFGSVFPRSSKIAVAVFLIFSKHNTHASHVHYTNSSELKSCGSKATNKHGVVTLPRRLFSLSSQVLSTDTHMQASYLWSLNYVTCLIKLDMRLYVFQVHLNSMTVQKAQILCLMPFCVYHRVLVYLSKPLWD
jgi:hypothetical protein